MATASVKRAGSQTYLRTPIKTHKVMFGEDLGGVIEQYAGQIITKDSVICLSEKFVTICQNNVRHADSVHETWLARLIVRFVTKHKNDIGYSHPKKMQVAIELAGYPRVIAATVIGGMTRLLLKRRGDFYRIAGNRIAEIDGFNPDAMPPFDQYAMLPPLRPKETCNELASRFGCACYIIDGNNINVEVIGMSDNMSTFGLDKAAAREVMLDNPMGQNDELTPIFIITRCDASAPQSPNAGSVPA